MRDIEKVAVRLTRALGCEGGSGGLGGAVYPKRQIILAVLNKDGRIFNRGGGGAPLFPPHCLEATRLIQGYIQDRPVA